MMLLHKSALFLGLFAVFFFYNLSRNSEKQFMRAYAQSFETNILALQGRDIEEETYQQSINQYLEDGDLLQLLKAAKKRYGV